MDEPTPRSDEAEFLSEELDDDCRLLGGRKDDIEVLFFGGEKLWLAIGGSEIG